MRALAVLMVAVIVWGVVEVAHRIYDTLRAPPFLLLTTEQILGLFASFMAVLIAIEIFHNITSYLRTDTIQIRIVLATGLMAVARKVVVLDYHATPPAYVFGTAALVAAIGLVYWLVASGGRQTAFRGDDVDPPRSPARRHPAPPLPRPERRTGLLLRLRRRSSVRGRRRVAG